jgi:hypothetical protein
LEIETYSWEGPEGRERLEDIPMKEKKGVLMFI